MVRSIFYREKKNMFETLENIVINYLFKNCDQDEKFEKKIYELSLYCFIDEVLFISSTKHSWLCECPVYNHKFDMKK